MNDKILWGQIAAVGAIVILAVWAATQWTAGALGYQPALGAPWFRIGDYPVYPPPAFFWWWFVYDAYAPPIFYRGAMIAASGGFVSIIVAIAMSVWRARERRRAETYGSARWADAGDIRRAGMLGDAGVIRLILNQIGRRLTEELNPAARPQRLLFMLDEFPALGRLDFFESALAFMAGYGIKAFLIAQSLNQIEKAYGPNNAILDNCHVRVTASQSASGALQAAQAGNQLLALQSQQLGDLAAAVAAQGRAEMLGAARAAAAEAEGRERFRRFRKGN
ncbi:type IV secretory system conjugative DNA transfer family protein [Sphingopyxis terrae]|nr:type IV secretory system conjugative DNA transfer family protein [Sphingopyxis terrae]MDX8356447.1 type IV secretory system conjugative DNA transfer family protein [Sphingopyxis terrae]